MQSAVVKKIIGILLVLIGLIALVTPFTPGSWLIIIGLELLGFRMLYWNKIKSRFFGKNKRVSDRQKYNSE